MLSIDITDRQIKAIKGKQRGDQVSVSKACVINLEPGIIFNGVVTDMPMAANLVAARLGQQQMRGKNAVVSITSNLIVFKELQIPIAKIDDFSIMVYHQMQSTMGIGDDYCISYVIMGETPGNSQNKMRRVLATACPQRLVDSCRQLFALLGIRLKAIYVSSNSLAKVLLRNVSYKTKMPMLLTQIDRDFISMSIFCHDQLQFSRFVRISQADYEADANYLASAAADNIFRMFQFYRNSFRDVVLCGQVEDVRPFQEALEPLGITPSVFVLPTLVRWPKDISPLLFINAIGALFPHNRKLTRINMLETIDLKERVRRKKDAFLVQLLATFLALSLLVGSGYATLSLLTTRLEISIAEISLELNDPENAWKLADLQIKQARLAAIRQFISGVQGADAAFSTLPKLDKEDLDPLENLTNGEIVINSYTLEGYTLTVNLSAVDQRAPSAYVQRLAESGAFAFVGYSGFQQNGANADFILTILLKGGEEP